jgi:hypothetical protein
MVRTCHFEMDQPKGLLSPLSTMSNTTDTGTDTDTEFEFQQFRIYAKISKKLNLSNRLRHGAWCRRLERQEVVECA